MLSGQKNMIGYKFYEIFKKLLMVYRRVEKDKIEDQKGLLH
jgi:hypothetical protein